MDEESVEDVAMLLSRAAVSDETTELSEELLVVLIVVVGAESVPLTMAGYVPVVVVVEGE